MQLLRAKDLRDEEIQEMMLRIQVPGYELARPFISEAKSNGIIDDFAAEGLYWDWQLRDLLVWMGAIDADQPTPPSASSTESARATPTLN